MVKILVKLYVAVTNNEIRLWLVNGQIAVNNSNLGFYWGRNSLIVGQNN